MRKFFHYSSFHFFFILHKNTFFEKYPKNKKIDKFLENIISKKFSLYTKLKKNFNFFEISKNTRHPFGYIIQKESFKKIIKKERTISKKERRKVISECLQEFLLKIKFKRFIERSETNHINPFFFLRFNVFGKKKTFIPDPLEESIIKINCSKVDYLSGLNNLFKNFYKKKKISKNFLVCNQNFPAYFYFRFDNFFISFDSLNYIFTRIYHGICENFPKNQIEIKYLNNFSHQINRYDNSNIYSYPKKKILQTRISLLGNFELFFKNRVKIQPPVIASHIGVFLNSRLIDEYGQPFFNFYEYNLIPKKKHFLWGERIFF
jgi:hypothetical protein